MWEAVAVAVIAALVVTGLALLWREARARDRLPIEIRDATDHELPHEVPPSFVFETEPPSPLPMDPWREKARYVSWAQANGGVPANRLHRRFTIRGTEDGPVRLDRVAVKVLEQRPMLHGYLLTAAAGGDSADREIYADLDDIDPARYAQTDQTIHRVEASTGDFVEQPWKLVDVSKTDVETFVVVAHTNLYDCDFAIEVHYRGKHRSGKVDVVAQDGRPFRVSAVADEIPTTYINDTSG